LNEKHIKTYLIKGLIQYGKDMLKLDFSILSLCCIDSIIIYKDAIIHVFRVLF